MRACRRRTVSMLWPTTSGRASRTTPRAASSTPRKSGVRSSTVAAGSFLRQRPDRRRVVTRSAVRQVVAIDRGDDNVVETHLVGGLRETKRLERIGWLVGLPGMDVAIAAGSRARVAEDLERRCSPSPALADVGAARLFADRVQPSLAHEALDLVVARVDARPADLHPFRPARALCHRQRLLHGLD